MVLRSILVSMFVLSCGKGQKGDTGAQGAQGKTGATGAAGKDGVNGINGQDGKDGVDGKDSISTETTIVIKEVITEKEYVVDGSNETVISTCKASFPGLKGLAVEHFVMESGAQLMQISVKDLIVSKSFAKEGAVLQANSSVYGISAIDLWTVALTEYNSLKVTHVLSEKDKTLKAVEKFVKAEDFAWVKSLLEQKEQTWELPCE